METPSDCECFSPNARYDQFHERRSLDWDTTNGRFADVQINECVTCGQLWLRYFVEYEAFTCSGRWGRGMIDPVKAMTIRPEDATSFLAKLPSYIRGGSFFGKAEVVSGSTRWDL